MGVPRLYRYIVSEAPKDLLSGAENLEVQVDNFYLDVNGIIHNASHNDGFCFAITEEQIFQNICNYIDTLFNLIKPRKLFFLGVDGPPPMSKINSSQRPRRFRTAMDAKTAASKRGDILEERASSFDPNCITPGTDFMVNLDKALQEFIKRKLETDMAWQKIEVILSGHSAPGEGEQKMMTYIRQNKNNLRHCIYGQDADLIILGLSTHLPDLILLREEVKFTNRREKPQRFDPSNIKFNILYFDRLREYIEKEFLPLKSKMRFKFDLEAIIDDWIFLVYIIGNDFVPQIPHFHIHRNGLPTIFHVYQTTLTKLDGYLNERGVLNLKRFKIFAKALSEADFGNYRRLLKENGGECARDDFTKLNTFVRHKIRIPGIKDNRKTYTRAGNNNNPTNHSYNHRPDVWYNIQSRNQHQSISNGQRANYTPNRSLNTRQIHSNSNNASKSARVGVHSFTEEQINNSMTVCADGDFIDLSDDEYLSDEKFPGEKSTKSRMLKNGTLVGVKRGVISSSSHLNNSNCRSTPKKELRNNRAAKEFLPKKPSTEMEYFEAYKRTYYREKLKLEPNKESVMKVVHEYVRALQWNLHYYYHGCVSWGWFYPYHYAPFISDVANFQDVDTSFELGEPLKPFEQLLAVLPAASSSLLPKTYRSLVTSTSSPLAKYFPTEVEYDLNGKQNDWEAVVLVPFVDADVLLKATVLYNLFLTQEERDNNKHGPHLLYHYVASKTSNKISEVNQRVPAGFVKCESININEFHSPKDQIMYRSLKSDSNNMPTKISINNNNNNNSDHKSNYNSYASGGNNINHHGNHKNSNSYHNYVDGHNNKANNNYYHQSNRRSARIKL